MAKRTCDNGETKVCTGCSRELPLSKFPTRAKPRGDGRYRRARCRDCEADAARQWRADNRDYYNRRTREYRKRNPVTMARVNLRRDAARAGLNPDDVEAYFRTHGGLCDICQKPPRDRHLAIDHDHATGAFRGLICRKCNSALGYFNDDLALLRSAVRYFERDVSGLIRLRAA